MPQDITILARVTVKQTCLRASHWRDAVEQALVKTMDSEHGEKGFRLAPSDTIVVTVDEDES